MLRKQVVDRIFELDEPEASVVAHISAFGSYNPWAQWGMWPGMGFPPGQFPPGFPGAPGFGGNFPVPGQLGATPGGAGPVFLQIYNSGSPAVANNAVAGTPLAGTLVTVTAPTQQQFPWFFQNPSVLWTYDITVVVIPSSPQTATILGDPILMSLTISNGNAHGTVAPGGTFTITPQWQVIDDPAANLPAGKYTAVITVDYVTN